MSDMPLGDEDEDFLDGLSEEEGDPKPQAIFQEVPDELAEDWTHGVLIGGMATEASDEAVADAFISAAEELIEPAIRSGEAWRFTYPILFLVRHAIEIYLKAILKPQKLNHQLGPMVAELKEKLRVAARRKLREDITNDLEALARIDPTGTSFRYTTIKGKHGVSWVPLEGEYWMPLGNLRRRMTVIVAGLKAAERLLN
jgi:hypothetical protein